MGLFDKNAVPIRKVKVLGLRYGKQTKMTATVNFPVYSFLLEYENGGREIKEYSGDSKKDLEEMNKILRFIDM